MTIETIALGSQGLEVTKLGFGCMGLTTGYGKKLPDDEIVSLLEKVAEKGVRLWDTANLYVFMDLKRLLLFSSPIVCQEDIIKKGLEKVGRDKIVIATKTGVQDTPIEVSMMEMKKLVQEGKVKYVGLSECSASTIRCAHKIHPITAVQLEYSLWCRGIEKEIMPTCKKLGIGVVAYSPLGRGFFGGVNTKELDKRDWRQNQERLQGETGAKNAKMLEELQKIADRKGVTTSQLALAWVEAQQYRCCGLVAIPGTSKEKNLISNVESLGIQVSKQDIADMEKAVPWEEVGGERYSLTEMCTWETDKNRELTPEEAKELGL